MTKRDRKLSARRAGGFIACAAFAVSASADVMTSGVSSVPLAHTYTLGTSWQMANLVNGNNSEFTSLTAAEVEASDPFFALAELRIDADPIREAVDLMDVDVTFTEVALVTGEVANSVVSEADKKCLATALYYEARNQSSAGQMAVADVILNRVDSSIYPDSVCDVVYQGSHREVGCQFSFTCDGSLDRPVDVMAMKDAQQMAEVVLSGLRFELTNGGLNYHATYVSPYWAPLLQKTAQIDDHVFYVPARYAQAGGMRISGQ